MTWEGLDPPYSTIVADPPWMSDRFKGGSRRNGHPGRHYSTMDVQDVIDMPVSELASASAHLWLWCTNALLEDGYRAVRSWGFTPMTVLTWCKPGPGVGQYLRTNTEPALLATRGTPMPPDDPPLSTWWEWPRGRHSEKPPAFMDLVEQVSPGPYVELFARAPRLGWDSWGHGYEVSA